MRTIRTFFKFLSSTVLVLACQPSDPSQVKVTTVAQTSVKRQAIGNCWLYAQASWLESMLKVSEGQDINVSETYWTYWDLYRKLLERNPVPEDKLNTGGSWRRSASIIREYGWVEEGTFISSENDVVMSESQLCAQNYIMDQGRKGGSLHDTNLRSPTYVRQELDKAFSCNGRLHINMDAAWASRRRAEDTMLKDVKTGEEASLSRWLDRWQEVSSPGYTRWGGYEGKKLGTETEFAAFRKLEQRMKAALNDHQPLVLSFFVSFNAPDANGMFNLNTLAQAADLGTTGGHMVVLKDYTVRSVPTEQGLIELGEGDLPLALKQAALQGSFRYLVTKNSWGQFRKDRPWLKNGYSRITWDYLQNRYYDEESGLFQPFLRSVVLPPGY